MENKLVIARFKSASEADALIKKLLASNPMAETSPLNEKETIKYFTKAM
jgi:hypothetical protein